MPETDTASHSNSCPVQFPPTLWTVVLEAKQTDPECAGKALGKLCEHYQEAILGSFRLMCRHRQDAEDLASEFIKRTLEGKTLASFDRSRCERFRYFLKAALRNFFRDSCDKQNSAKRGRGKSHASVEELSEAGLELPVDDLQLQRAVDLPIVRLVHQRVMATLEKEARDPQRFAALRESVTLDVGHEAKGAIRHQLGLSDGAFRKAICDLRYNYTLLFRAEIAQMVRNEREIDNEMRELLPLLVEAVASETQERS